MLLIKRILRFLFLAMLTSVAVSVGALKEVVQLQRDVALLRETVRSFQADRELECSSPEIERRLEILERTSLILDRPIDQSGESDRDGRAAIESRPLHPGSAAAQPTARPYQSSGR